MNTYNQIADYVDIDNIPLHKWMHLTVMCYGNKLDVFLYQWIFFFFKFLPKRTIYNSSNHNLLYK